MLSLQRLSLLLLRVTAFKGSKTSKVPRNMTQPFGIYYLGVQVTSSLHPYKHSMHVFSLQHLSLFARSYWPLHKSRHNPICTCNRRSPRYCPCSIWSMFHKALLEVVYMCSNTALITTVNIHRNSTHCCILPSPCERNTVPLPRVHLLMSIRNQPNSIDCSICQIASTQRYHLTVLPVHHIYHATK